MNFKFWGNDTTEKRAYSDVLLAAILASASGNLTASAVATAVAEFAIGLWERGFAVAGVKPEGLARTALTPLVLAQMGRRLPLLGNAVFLIDTSSGELKLIPVSEYEVTGSYKEKSWRYRLQLPGPSGLAVMEVPARQVVHIRMGAPAERPWEGCSPLANAGLTAQMAGRLEQRMTEEQSARVGSLLIMPENVSDETVAQLKTDLVKLKGNIALAETGSGGHGQGARGAPQIDWQLKRFGADTPANQIQLRENIQGEVCQALGISRALWNAPDGASAREGFRMLLVATLQPVAELAMAELSDKLEMDISIEFGKLFAADIQARARSFGTMIQAGVDVEEAKTISGLTA